MLRVGIAGIGSIARVYLGLFAAGKIPGGRVTALSSRNMTHLTGARDAFCTPDAALFLSLIHICITHKVKHEVEKATGLTVARIEVSVDDIVAD